MTLPSFILHSGLFWFCIMIFRFGCRGKGGKLDRLAWSHALMVSGGGGRHPRLWLWRRTPWAAQPQLHTGSHGNAGAKMGMIGRKYALADAKINCKTFTFKMRSWNSSKRKSTPREGRGRHRTGKLVSQIHFWERSSQGTFMSFCEGLMFIRWSYLQSRNKDNRQRERKYGHLGKKAGVRWIGIHIYTLLILSMS